MNSPPDARRRLARRYAAERRFRRYGQIAILLALGALALLLASVVARGYPAFTRSEIALDVTLDPALIDKKDYQGLVKEALKATFPDVAERGQRKQLFALVSPGAGAVLRKAIAADPGLVGQSRRFWLPADDEVDLLLKSRGGPAGAALLAPAQIAWVESLAAKGAVRRSFDAGFFTEGDSREPELAGIFGALLGSLFTMLVTLLLALPLGVLTALYLEEFAPRNRLTALIEVNINNLAAVPSIVFGLLGLAIFLNLLHLPRGAPLVGGMVLALMSLPGIIIAARAALQAVPPSIREAAYALGASPLQSVLHHVLPLAVPGIMTGAIIGMARALGESAPLLMIGMVAFIADAPRSPLEPASVLPVQIYLWADAPERAFVAKTAAAILVLLAFLILMNAAAIAIRRRFERRW